MNKKKSVYTCESCNALFVCLRYFQEHRKGHAIQEGRTIFSCTHCQIEHTSEHESHLHSISHKDEPPHSCHLCQAMLEGISEEEVHGSRRSIGTATDDYLFHISLDKPMLDVTTTPAAAATTTTTTASSISNNSNNNSNNNNINNNNSVLKHEDPDEDDQDDDDDDDDDDDEDDEDDDEDDDDDDDDDDNGEDDDGEEEEDEEIDKKHIIGANNNNSINNDDLNTMCKPNVTNIFYVTNQTITTSQNNFKPARPSRPSRSTGKGKGNRKARLTSDGDIRRKFSCCHCGKSFKTKSHLQRHILTHTGEKPYHCNRCDCRFNQSSSLRNHVIAIHTKEYPHTCNNCSKGFLMPAVLQKHLQTSECGKISGQVVEGL